MIFNLIGPPAVGKSTLATKACAQIKDIRHISIDFFRATTQSEKEAWGGLASTVLENKGHLIIESSGLSWQLKDQIIPRALLAKKQLQTIKVSCNDNILRERLLSRQTYLGVPGEIAEAEQMFLDYAIPRIYIKDSDLELDTSSSLEVPLQQLTSFLLDNCWIYDKSRMEEEWAR